MVLALWSLLSSRDLGSSLVTANFFEQLFVINCKVKTKGKVNGFFLRKQLKFILNNIMRACVCTIGS